MSFVTEHTAIRAKFADWTETKVKWFGVPFSEPAVAYIAVTVVNAEGEIATLGEPHLRRHTAAVICQLFDKENKVDGDARIRELADMLSLRFINANSRLTISATEWLDFGTPSLSAPQILGGWLQRNLTITYARNLVS